MFNDFFGTVRNGNGNFPTDLEIFVTAAILVAIGAVLVAGRRAEDPRSLRPAARYLSAICLLTLFVSLFAAFGTMQALTDLVVNHTARLQQTKADVKAENTDNFSGLSTGVFLPVGNAIFDFSAEPNNDSNYAAAMASGLVAITAGGVFFLHARWRKRLARAEDVPGAVMRVDRAYNYGVCFVAAITVAVGVTSAGFGLFEVIAPGVAIGGNTSVAKATGLAELAAFGALAIVAALVFVVSWRRGGRRDFAALRDAIGGPGAPAGTAPEPSPGEPTTAPPEPPEAPAPPAPPGAEPDGGLDDAVEDAEIVDLAGDSEVVDDAERAPAVHWNGRDHESELSVN
jgi:uncharacterized protein DUF5671